MSALSYEIRTGVADELKWLRSEYNSSVVNVMVSIGLLVIDTETKKLGEVTVSRNGQQYKVWNKQNKVLFDVEMLSTGASVEVFTRGLWEELLDKLSRGKLDAEKSEKYAAAGTKVIKTRKPKERATE